LLLIKKRKSMALKDKKNDNSQFLNENIPFSQVLLVTSKEEKAIVSRQEALNQAKSLEGATVKVNLVMVGKGRVHLAHEKCQKLIEEIKAQVPKIELKDNIPGIIQGLLFCMDGFVSALLKSPFNQMCYAINKAEGISYKKRDSIITKATESNEHCKETLKKFGVLTISGEVIKVILLGAKEAGDKEKFGPY
ncbi:10308_t:CDS:2, partial [Funneliformis geosporum]